MRARLLFVSVMATALACSLPSPASADDDASDVLAASLKKFDEGRVAFEHGRYDEARAAFEASNRLQASPNSLLYIGRCWRETGKIATAYVTLVRSAREAQERLTTTFEKRYAATRDAATAEAAALAPRVPRLAVDVPPASTLPEGFAVFVDGRPLPRESWGLALETDPGTVVVTASGARMRPFHETTTLVDGSAARVRVPVDRVPTAVISLQLSSWPSGVVVTIDGAPVDPREASAPRDLDTGHHTVVVRAPSYTPFRWEKDLADGARERVVVDLVPAPTPAVKSGLPAWMFWAAAGASVATIAGGSALAVDAKARESTELGKNPLLRDTGERDAIRTQSTVANALFVSGALLGAAAVVLFFATDVRPRRHVGTADFVLGGPF